MKRDCNIPYDVTLGLVIYTARNGPERNGYLSPTSGHS